MIEVIAAISIFINVALITFYFIWSGKIIKTQKTNGASPYATTCEKCELDFDFGDLDIEFYIENGKQHQITRCPRCHNYINVDP